MSHSTVTLPRLTTLLRQATPRLLEGVIAPLAVFYLTLLILGELGAMLAATGWVYLCVGIRLLRRSGMPATMFLAALAATARTAVSVFLGDPKLYFLPPELGTVCLSVAFLVSIGLNRPLAEKVALDYVHLPRAVLRNGRVRQFFVRVTLLWAFVLLTNSALGIWLLLHDTLGGYLLIRTSAVALISGGAITVSVVAFRRVLRRLHPA